MSKISVFGAVFTIAFFLLLLSLIPYVKKEADKVGKIKEWEKRIKKVKRMKPVEDKPYESMSDSVLLELEAELYDLQMEMMLDE